MAKKKMWEDEVISEFEQIDIEESAENEDFDVDAFVEDLDEEEEEIPVQKQGKTAKQAYTLNSKETDIMQSAMVQLEQAKLYDMFLKHNLFEGVKANTVALKKVERELKEFILERMQILLGMKSEKQANTAPQSFRVELPFNEIEIDCLKDLAFKVTKGESAKAKTKSVEALPSIKRDSIAKVVGENRMKPMVQEVEEEYEEEELEIRKPVKPVQRQVRPQPKKPVNTNKMSVQELALHDLKQMAKRKPAHLMSEDELIKT
jgi:hypothetical protein